MPHHWRSAENSCDFAHPCRKRLLLQSLAVSATLDADAANLLGTWAAASRGAVEDQPIDQLRNSGLINSAVTGDSPRLFDVHDAVVDSAAGPPVPIRVYRPDAVERPVIVYGHGGGWTLLSIDAADTLCRELAIGSGCVVVSVGYRLAPEHPFPAAFDDMWAVTTWAADGGLGWVPARLGVGGDSAGGNLAAALALHARDTSRITVDLQLLLYPATGLDLDTPSMRELGDDSRFRLSASTMRWFWGNYLEGDFTIRDQRAVPAAAVSFAGLAPAVVVTPAFDPLCDDGRRYAKMLRDAGVATDLVEPTTLPHGFAMMLGAVPAARTAYDAIIRKVRSIMHPSASGLASAAAPRALAAEFRRRPFGTHSADLQTLLHQMRSEPLSDKPFLFISDTNREWVLGRYNADTPPVPIVDWSIRFTDLESAEWYVFKDRWRKRFGEELDDE